MFLKVMSDEHHLKDSDLAKNFLMIEIPKGHRVFFKKDESYPEEDSHKIALIGPWAGLEGICEPWEPEMKSQVVAIPANAYLISDAGDTIGRQSSLPANGHPQMPDNSAELAERPVSWGSIIGDVSASAEGKMITTRQRYNRYRALSAKLGLHLSDEEFNELRQLRAMLNIAPGQ